LSAWRRGTFVFKIPGRRLHQAFDILYWWPTARFGLSPPTSTGNDTPITAALVNVVLHHVSSSGRKVRKVRQMGILFGTAQVWHQALVMARVRHPGLGLEGEPETSWQRLRLFRDGPRESTLISVRYRDLQPPCILFSQLCDERSKFSKLALRSECSFGRVPPAWAVTSSSSVSSTDWVLL
jgi:hypothetical protein